MREESEERKAAVEMTSNSITILPFLLCIIHDRERLVLSQEMVRSDCDSRLKGFVLLLQKFPH